MIAGWFSETYINDNTDLIFGTNLFASAMPDMPDNAVAIFDESGPSEGYMNEYASDFGGLNVYCRGSYSFVSEYSWKIHNLIVNLTNTDTGDFYLKVVRIQSTPEHIELDQHGRRRVFAHYHVLINQKTYGNRQPTYTP